MKVYETREVPARPATTERVCVGRSCDLCGRKAARGGEWSDGGWYAVDETEVAVTVKHKAGHDFPEGGNWTEWEVDLCPDCFVNKLVPWLNGQGADVKPKEVDT